jgi:uncharacterized membrane protein YphA (DoxX/SURF4 family)
MKRSTAVLLVLLRLAIGWHFVVEGYHKLHTHLVGPTVSVTGASKPFSSEAYFREGTGPLARLLRDQIGDLDDEALAHLEVAPVPAGQDPANVAARQRIPPRLDQEWRDYLDRFTAHYGLDAGQQAAARAKVEQAEDAVVAWLTKIDVDAGTKALARRFQAVNYEVKRSVPQRIAEYKTKVGELHDAVEQKMWLLGRDTEGRSLGQLKADVAERRKALLDELREQHTQKLQDDLAGVLTDQQRQRGPVPAPEPPGWLKKLNVVPEPRSPWLLWGLDLVTVWGLTAVGACLLLGLFTRTACVLAAGFLAMTYLCFPPFPWLPTPPNNEGTYLFVNKNVIEMIALLALATTASGRWFGLDAFLHQLSLPFRRRARRAGARA